MIYDAKVGHTISYEIAARAFFSKIVKCKTVEDLLFHMADDYSSYEKSGILIGSYEPFNLETREILG